MIDIKSLDWEKLKQPSKYLKVFDATNKQKLMKFAEHLVEDDYNLSDELRRYDIVWNNLFPYYFGGKGVNIFYEIGDFFGVLGFTYIQPEYKAEAVMKFWEPKEFGATLVRDVSGVFDVIMDSFKLKRLSSETADQRVVKMSKMVGFTVEGARWGDFIWKGKPLTRYMLGMTEKGRKKWRASREIQQTCKK